MFCVLLQTNVKIQPAGDSDFEGSHQGAKLDQTGDVLPRPQHNSRAGPASDLKLTHVM